MTQDNILDEIVEVKVGDNQKGYLWAKLSPKSKKRLRTFIASEIKGVLDRLVEKQKYYPGNPSDSAVPIYIIAEERQKYER